MNQSLTIKGLIIIILGNLLRYAKIQFVNDDLTTAVNIAFQLAGAITVFWGRYRQGDINLLGLKKPE